MAHRPRSRFIPRVETLEVRTAPSAAPWLTESFDGLTPGALPSGWSWWSNTAASAANTFGASTQRSLSPSNSLTSFTGSSATNARAWLGIDLPADVQAGAAIYLGSQAPAQVLVRGRNLASATPSYYAVSVTAGLQVQLLRVVNGTSTVLGQLRSSDFVFNQWVRVSLNAMGNTLRVQVFRLDTNQYLNPSGHWQTGSAWAVTVNDTALTGPGMIGLGRLSGASGLVHFDDLAVELPGASQSFDTTPVGQLPSGWAQWTSTPGGTNTFQVATVHAARTPNGLTATATNSSAIARDWDTIAQPADVQVSASIFADSLVPLRLLARGSNLNSAKPTYYALSLARGLDLQLLRVVNGVPTVLAHLNSAGYVSGLWLQTTLYVAGNSVRAQVYRADTGQYLNAAGQWQTNFAWALNVSDSGVSGAGLAGVERPASYTGSASLDDFAVYPILQDKEAPTVQLTGPAAGATLTGTVAVQAAAQDNLAVSRVEFYVDNVLQSVSTTAPYTWSWDTTTAANGQHTLTAMAYDAAGNSATTSETLTTQNNTALPVPVIPQHYSWIRLAELAYTGTPFDSQTDQLLQQSVDLVVPAPDYLAHIHSVAANTPQLLYTNVSTLYQDLLLDWLNYADAHGLDRESAFYHAARATPYSGNSASSQPVNWFWGVYRGDTNWTSFTSAAHGSAPGGVTFGGVGQSLYIGYTDRFREINFNLTTPASAGWSGVLEYATAVNSSGQPTNWAPLKTLTDTTNGLTQSGQVTFDPPSDWKPGSVLSGSPRLFYVRIRTVHDGTAPVAATILGRDFTNAKGGTTGVIPAFDYSADTNHDGYLDDQEYANRRPGFDARFAYEARLPAGSYGAMRFATNPSNAAFRAWAVDYETRFLQSQPLASGLFVDNSAGGLPINGDSAVEPTAAYTNDYAATLNAISRAIAPRWVLANVGGGGTTSNPVIQKGQAYFDEFLLRPLQNDWQDFETVAGLVAERATLKSPAPYAILDSLPTVGKATPDAPNLGSPTDARTQLATLAYYYLLADPKSTFLDFYGGYDPNSSWSQHWSAAAAYNVGQPLGSWSLFASGSDPSNTALTYHVYQRQYSNALVLYRPLSYGNNTDGTLGNASAVTFNLSGTYSVLNADGTLGPAVSSVTLHNGEGAILIKK